MAEKTQLNREGLSVNNTVLNPSLNQVQSATVLNPEIILSYNVKPGQVLFGRYNVLKKLDVLTGEADLYLCTRDNKEYVAKIYRRKTAVKPEIFEKLMKIDSPYIAKLFETGDINGYPVEIIPYYAQGSLQGRTYSYEQLRKTIIPCLNEGLRVLHSNGVIHKDLKPSNIMVTDNNMNVAIIDFGISSVREDNNTVIVTKTGLTPEYSAPETFRNLFLEESDYFSFGITLYELFCGYTPYNSMNKEEIEQYSMVQRIPFPQNMPTELQNLIAACTYYDITNRKNKSNPNRRWIYGEVKKWCDGIKQTIPGEGIGNSKSGDINPYNFVGKTYTEISELTKAMAVNWNEGKKQLFRGILSGFLKGCNPELAGYCIDAEEEAARTNGKDDIIFWNLLYKLNANTLDIYWKGHVYQGGLPSLGREILENLWKHNESSNPFYYEMLNEGILSKYIDIKLPKSKELKIAVKGLEDGYKMADTKRKKSKNLYLMGYMLSGQKLFHMNGHDFRTIGEFAGYLKLQLDESYEKFQEVCHSLIDYEDNLDIQFESWLLALGKKNELTQWKDSLKE